MAQDELCLDGEEWRDIAGYEGYYQVSNLGRVRSVDRVVSNGENKTKLIRGHIMKQTLNNKNGYYAVALTKCNKRKLFTTHRLVATAFVNNPYSFGYVDHIDGVKTNNVSTNLRWYTNKQNAIYAKKYVDYGSWLNKPIVRSDGVRFNSISEASRIMNCSKTAIDNVLKGRTMTCMGYTFRYA